MRTSKESKTQEFGSILDPHDERVTVRRDEGVGLILPERNIAHEDPDWFQLDTDDQIEDPDIEPVDPLPTTRHREVP